MVSQQLRSEERRVGSDWSSDVCSSDLYRHPISYFKPAFGLYLLREYILGHDRFDYAFRQYTQRWAFKHPSPDDFFHTMANESGEDLSWFWREWFHNN